MATIRARQAAVYVVTTATGEITFTEKSTWNGFREWVDPSGRQLIVLEKPSGSFSDAFAAIGLFADGGRELEFLAVRAGPELTALLGLSGGR